MIYDSVLSEFAALGFEYGYSVADPTRSSCWEAQFGDFANGAQTIIDQFIVAAEDKWGQRSGLVLLLPHGFEGQGPEHSSARGSSASSCCAREDNIRVVYPTTAAQYFHVLRRQVHDPERKPLIVHDAEALPPHAGDRTPRPSRAHRRRRSSLVLDDPAEPDPDVGHADRVLHAASSVTSCMARRDEMRRPVAIVRLEQLYPWPEREIAARARTATRRPRCSGRRRSRGTWAPATSPAAASRSSPAAGPSRVVARPESPSPATGSSPSTTPSSKRCWKRPSPRHTPTGVDARHEWRA